jgi:hypothetical protein
MLVRKESKKSAGSRAGAQPLPGVRGPRRFLRFLGGSRGLNGAGQYLGSLEA